MARTPATHRARDRAADQRDLQAGVRDRLLAGQLGALGSDMRRRAARDRLAAMLDRQASRQDRQAAALDRRRRWWRASG